MNFKRQEMELEDFDRKNVIYIAPYMSTFAKNDIKILSKKYKIITHSFSWYHKQSTPINLISQFFFLVSHLTSLKAIIVSFGGYWSFLPSLLGKITGVPVFIILNGTDCVSFPEINYGTLRFPFLRFIIKKSYQWAYMLLPVSKSLVYNKNTYFSDEDMEFGYKHHLSNVNTQYTVLSNGVDINFWQKKINVIRDKYSFITILSTGQENVKGIDLILQLALELPSCNFYLAGIEEIEELKIGNNVTFLGRMRPKELRKELNKCQFYLQLSNVEGFGISLCEAMLCQCVPIVSSVNNLPIIVGEFGFILKKRNIKLLKELVLNILRKNNHRDTGKKAKERIIKNYSLSIRGKKLIAIIEKSRKNK